MVRTPELERYTRALHNKLNLPFDILIDLHLKIAEQLGLVFTFPDYLMDPADLGVAPSTGFMFLYVLGGAGPVVVVRPFLCAWSLLVNFYFRGNFSWPGNSYARAAFLPMPCCRGLTDLS